MTLSSEFAQEMLKANWHGLSFLFSNISTLVGHFVPSSIEREQRADELVQDRIATNSWR